jgi:hypothetical protein
MRILLIINNLSAAPTPVLPGHPLDWETVCLGRIRWPLLRKAGDNLSDAGAEERMYFHSSNSWEWNRYLIYMVFDCVCLYAG